jgi:hypothetical protein
MASMARPT